MIGTDHAGDRHHPVRYLRHGRGSAGAPDRCTGVDVRRISVMFGLGLGLSAFSTRGGPISTACSGRRSCEVQRSCCACCRRRGSRLAISRRTGMWPDASGLFNLMRNLGGAIGIALIDTILYGRSRNVCRGFSRSPAGGRCQRGEGDRPRSGAARQPAAGSARRGRRGVRAADGRKGVAGALCQRSLGDARLRGDCGRAAGAACARSAGSKR